MCGISHLPEINAKCQVCKKKYKILQAHHTVCRSSGPDRADNLITVCADCPRHAAHQPGGMLHTWQAKGKRVEQYKYGRS